jgi:heme/copper-type cytochrome/quinol oxidase subunit 3
VSVAVVREEVRTRPSGWWGMWLLIATEASLFGVLVASYFYLRFRTQPWPPDGVPKPSALLPVVATVALVVSSVPVAVAARGARRRQRGRMLGGLGVATVLAGIYVAVTAVALGDSARDFGPSKDAYASIYYLLNGAHAAHVVIGILVNLFLLLRLAVGNTRYRAIGVEVMALYWHFVNALAVVVLLTTLSPLL